MDEGRQDQEEAEKDDLDFLHDTHFLDQSNTGEGNRKFEKRWKSLKQIQGAWGKKSYPGRNKGMSNRTENLTEIRNREL